jgi:hypothetical protein
MDILTLPLENVILVTAAGERSNRVKKQAKVEFYIERDLFHVNFFISPQLMNDAILGCQFMKENGISLNCNKESFTYTKKGLVRGRPFYQPADTLKVERSNQFFGNVDTSLRSCTDRHYGVNSADCKLPVSLLEMREFQRPSVLQLESTGKYHKANASDSIGAHDYKAKNYFDSRGQP